MTAESTAGPGPQCGGGAFSHHLVLSARGRALPAVLTAVVGEGPPGFLDSAVSTLTPVERIRYDESRMPHRAREFALTRHAAKVAMGLLTGSPRLDDLEVTNGVFGEPLVNGPRVAGTRLTVSHSGEVVLALAHDRACPLGVDVQVVDDRALRVAAMVASDTEQAMVEQDQRGAEAVIEMWCAREALSKVLGTGFLVDHALFALSDVHCDSVDPDRRVWSFTHFRHYRATTARIAGHVVALCGPADGVLVGRRGWPWGTVAF